jgi:hypothetical protein
MCLPFIAITIVALAAAPASQPTDGQNSLANNQVLFIPPPADAWKYRQTKTPDSAYFQNTKGDSAIQLLWAPKDFQITPDIVGDIAGGIIKDLKTKHARQNVVVVMQPKIIKDKRFEIYIQEKFKVGDVTEDELHIDRSVGPRVLMATVCCVASDDDVLAATHKAGEDLLASAKFNRKAFKKTP